MSHASTIWIQSCSAESDAGIWGTYQASVRRHAREVVRKGLEVEFHGISRTYPGIDYVDSAIQLATLEVVRNAIRAEQAGYAAFAFISTNDAGNREVRELTAIPSAFIAEVASRHAAGLGGRFAFLTHNPGSLRKMEELAAARFGLGAQLVAGASADFTYNDFAGMYADPAPVLDRLRQEARGAIARGARVLVPAGGPLNMFLVDQGLREIDGVPLVDIHGVTFKEAERLADLKAPAAPSLPAAQREPLRALYLPQ